MCTFSQCQLCFRLHAKPPDTIRMQHTTYHFLLQRGIDLPSLDVAYFTSLSYYMLLLFGLRGVMSLMFKEDTIDETQMQKQQMTMGMGQMGQDPQKAFEQERAALDAVRSLSASSVHPIMFWPTEAHFRSMLLLSCSFACSLIASCI